MSAPISEGIVMDFDGFLGSQSPEIRASVNGWLEAIPYADRDAQKKTLAAQFSVAASMETPDLGHVIDNWSELRGGIAVQNQWDDADDDGRFFSKLHQATHQRQLERHLVIGPDDDSYSPDALSSLAFNAAVMGNTASEAFGEWQQKVTGKPGYSTEDEKLDGYYLHARKLHTAASERLAPVLDLAKESMMVLGGNDLEGFTESIAPRVAKLDERQRRDFLAALRVMADASPEGKGAAFWSNFATATQRGTADVGRGAADYGSFLRNSYDATAAMYLHGFDSAEANASVQKALGQLREHNLESDLRRVQEGNFSPVKEVLGDYLPGFVERGIYGTPGAVASSVMAMVPVVGLPSTFGTMYTQAYDQERFRLVDAGLSDHDASVAAGVMAPIIAAPQAVLEKLGAEAMLGGLPTLKAALLKLGDKAGGGLAGYGVRVLGGGLAELSTEVAQDLMNPIVETAAAALDQDLPGVTWRNGKDGVLDGWWSRTGETFVALLPLALFGAVNSGQKRVEALHGASDVQLRAFGARDEDITHFRAAVASGPLSAAHAAEELIANRDGSSDAAKAATDELAAAARVQADAEHGKLKADMREAGVVNVVRDEAGWKLVHDNGTETRVDSGRAAQAIVSDLMQARSQREADGLVALVDQWHDQAPAGDNRETRFTGEFAQGTGDAITYDRGGEVTRVVTDAATLDALDREARMDARGTGNEGIYVAVNGSNSVEYRERVADGARELVRRLEVNQSHSAPLTFLHEAIESNWRDAIAKGTITREQSQRAIAGIAGAFDPQRARDDAERAFRERVQRVASGQGNETELQETISELAVADAIGKRRDGGTMPAGAVTAAVDAMIRRTVNPAEAEALGGFRAFLRAAKQYFRGLLGTAAAIKKARSEGGATEFDALIEKLTGTSEQTAFDRAHAADLQALSDETGLAYVPPSPADEANGIAFSVSHRRAQSDPRQLDLLLTAATDSLNGNAAEISGQVDGSEKPASSSGVSQILGRIGQASKEELQAAITAGKGQVSSIIPDRTSREIPAWNINGATIEEPEDFAKAVQVIRSPYFESLKVAFLDENNRVAHSQIVFVGTLNEAIAAPRDIILALASAGKTTDARRVIISHNHPSGDPSPSNADRAFQRRIETVAEGLGLEVIDHVITNGETFFSMREKRASSLSDATLAPWENVPRSALKTVGDDTALNEVVNLLRSTNEDVIHAIYVNTKSAITAIERFDRHILPSALNRAVVEGAAREGAYGVMMDAGNTKSGQLDTFIQRLNDALTTAGMRLLDVSSTTTKSASSEGRVSEDPADIKTGGLAFSLAPGARVEMYRKQVEAALARDPDKRRALTKKANENLQRLQFNFETDRLNWRHDKIRALVEPRTEKQLQNEQDFREATRREELEAAVYGRYGEILDNDALTQAWGAGPVLAYLATPSPLHGRLMSKSEALRRYADAAGYDGAEGLPRFIFGGSLSVDEAAQALFEEGLISDGYVDTMWDSIRSEITTAARYQDFKASAKEELKLAKNTAHEEAAEWRREADAAQRKDYSPRARLVRDLRTLEAIASVMPAEVRARIGGPIKLAQLATDAAREKEIGRRIQRTAGLLENYLRKEYRAQIADLFDAARPKMEPGKKPKGSTTPEAQRLATMAEEFAAVPEAKMDGKRADIERAMLEDDADLGDLAERLQVLEMLGGMDAANAAQLDAAATWLADVIATGKNLWRAKEEARVAAQTADAKALKGDTGKEGDIAELQKALDAEKSLKREGSGFVFGLISFEQAVTKIFGKASEVGQRLVEKARAATYQRTDALRVKRAAWKAAMQEIFSGKKWGDVMVELWNHSEVNGPLTVTAGRLDGPAPKIEKVPVAIAERVVNGTEEQQRALGFDSNEVLQLEQLLAENDARDAAHKLEQLDFMRFTNRTPRPVPMSQLQAVNMTMLARQRDYSATLAHHGWTPEVLDEIEGQLTPEAQQIRAWLAREYRDGHESINAVFQRMFGAMLPMIENYSPGTWESLQPGIDMTPDGGGAMGLGGLSPGPLKTRRVHRAAPRLADALAVYWAHTGQIEHFKAFAEFTREARGVMLRPEVRASIQEKAGKQGLATVADWLSVFENDGVRSSVNLTTAERISTRLQNATAISALAWNVGTLAKQSLAVINSAFEMPALDYVRGFSKLVTGQLDFRAILGSEMIRRRVEAGASPELRQVMAGLAAAHPGKHTRRVRELVQFGMESLGEADGFFTAASAAIHHDWVKREALVSGLDESQAERAAMSKTQAMIDRTSQPVELMNRSLYEAKSATNPNVRWLFMFASEARQKAALYGVALGNVVKGEGTAQDWRVLAISHVFAPLMMQTLVNLLSDARDDDDREFFDDKHWSAADYVKAMLLGPAMGFPLAGKAMNEILSGIMGTPSFKSDPTNPLDGLWTRVGSGIKTLRGDNKAAEKENSEGLEVLFDTKAEKAVGAASAAMNFVALASAIHPGGEPLQWLGAAGNQLKQWAQWFDNFTPDTASEERSKQRAAINKARKAAKEAAK